MGKMRKEMNKRCKGRGNINSSFYLFLKYEINTYFILPFTSVFKGAKTLKI